MKNYLIVLSLAFLGLSTFPAQGQERIREAGLTFWSLDQFGFNFKTGTPQALWRFGSAYLSGSKHKDVFPMNYEAEHSSYGIGLEAGREFRKPVFENVEFRYGVNVGFSYSRNKIQSKSLVSTSTSLEDRRYFGPALEALLGLNYVINEKFLLGIEVSPGMSYTKGTVRTKSADGEDIAKNDISRFDVGASSSPVMLTLAYRITKE